MSDDIEACDCGCEEEQSKPDKRALRYNEGKPRFDLLPPRPLEDIAKVFTMGAEKYDDDNWRKGMEWRKCVASLMRHVNAFNSGEDCDKESGLPHMAHVAVNAMFLLEYMRTHRELDDRFKEGLSTMSLLDPFWLTKVSPASDETTEKAK